MHMRLSDRSADSCSRLSRSWLETSKPYEWYDMNQTLVPYWEVFTSASTNGHKKHTLLNRFCSQPARMCTLAFASNLYSIGRMYV